jgi:hypothetical protein
MYPYASLPRPLSLATTSEAHKEKKVESPKSFKTKNDTEKSEYFDEEGNNLVFM